MRCYVWTILLPLHCECCDYGFYYPAKYIILAIRFNFLIILHIHCMTTFFYTRILRLPSTICWKVALNQLTTQEMVSFWDFFCHLILLVCDSVFLTVLHHFPYCSFVLTSEIRKSNSTETVLFQTCSIILGKYVWTLAWIFLHIIGILKRVTWMHRQKMTSHFKKKKEKKKE